MVCIITGDLINSRQFTEVDLWLQPLKELFQTLTTDTSQWAFYRGDSFQLELSNPLQGLTAALLIKASVRMIKGLDVRMGIGLGDKTHQGTKVTESNGPAYLNSGEAFESLQKQRVNLALKSPNETFDHEFNLYLKLALIAMDNWTPNTAEMVKLSLLHPDLSQKQIGSLAQIKQNTVSERLTRGYFTEIQELNQLYQTKLKQLY